MSEELEQTPGGETAPEQREYSPVEQKAIEQGWRPKEEFSGDPDSFIEAAEFVRRGELFSKIEHQSKELKQVRAALEALKEHNSKIKETEYKRALKTLDEARKQALVEGETDRFFALEERMEEVKAEKADFDRSLEEVKAPAEQELNPEFVSWVSKNNWYESNKAMRAYADKLGVELAQEGHRPSKVLEMVEAEIKKEFAHKFQNQKTSRPQAVESPSRTGTTSGGFQLSDDERRIMRRFVESGVMTEKDYIQQLKGVR
jgi:hypothetical protein